MDKKVKRVKEICNILGALKAMITELRSGGNVTSDMVKLVGMVGDRDKTIKVLCDIRLAMARKL